jgi:hypothetical protein
VHAELNGEPARTGDPLRHAEIKEELSEVIEGIRALPERQRAALVLAEFHALSQAEIGSVLGVRSDQVKAYVFQARSNLLSEREARSVACSEIREQLATSRGAMLLRARLRRHVRGCPSCRQYADDLAAQRQRFAALLPIFPVLALRFRAFEESLSLGASGSNPYTGGTGIAGAAAEMAGGGITAIAVKVAASLAALGASAGVGVSMLAQEGSPRSRAGATPEQAQVSVRVRTTTHSPLIAPVRSPQMARSGSISHPDTSPPAARSPARSRLPARSTQHPETVRREATRQRRQQEPHGRSIAGAPSVTPRQDRQPTEATGSSGEASRKQAAEAARQVRERQLQEAKAKREEARRARQEARKVTDPGEEKAKPQEEGPAEESPSEDHGSEEERVLKHERHQLERERRERREREEQGGGEPPAP